MSIHTISDALGIAAKQVQATVQLLDEGCTIPFISRYRKERTGELDEVQVEQIRDLQVKLAELAKRKAYVIEQIKSVGSLTADIENAIKNATQLSDVEDLYLPFKPKRKTRASKAIELGLEPLAKMLMKQNVSSLDDVVNRFAKKGISYEEALKGAQDIIAEWVSESKVSRDIARRSFQATGVFKSVLVKGKDEEGEKFRDYFKFEERLNRCKSHRVLALFRGEEAGVLKLKIVPDTSELTARVERYFIKGNSASSEAVATAVKDSCKRLIIPAIETEFRKHHKGLADAEAIKVFADNLRQLLMGSPVGSKTILALDPGFRTGCKLVCLNAAGELKHNETIFPHTSNKRGAATKKILSLVNQYKIEAIAIGNGTAGRETEQFIKDIRFSQDVEVYIVNEAGASIYSASAVAREEFPNYDVTVRGAVSIGRRLMDPLAELVKIDPKSIGVGQYQHDVDQKQLKASLDRVVESCVNAVGVDLNTASKYLLAYVSGLGPQLAQNIVDYRKENGLFESRNQLKKVKRMGDKAFEQSAGFLRITDGSNALDNSAVHPEQYALVNKLAKRLSMKAAELVGNERAREIEVNDFVTNDVGVFTLNELVEELAKPGRDPRKAAKVFEFARGLRSMEDLQVGMKIPGLVTNVTNFGAFVDVGVKQDGLVHISNLADEYISNPADHVRLNQQVQVTVIEADPKRKRIGLSMKA